MGGKVLELESDKLIEQGLELGRLENQMATAVKMLQVGKYTIEEIADISGLTVKKICALNMTAAVEQTFRLLKMSFIYGKEFKMYSVSPLDFSHKQE